MTTSTNTQTPYEKGRRDFLLGIHCSECPYIGKKCRIGWINGWNDAWIDEQNTKENKE